MRLVIILAAVSIGVACGPPPKAIIVVHGPQPVRHAATTDTLAMLPVDQVIIPTRPLTLAPANRESRNRITMSATNANVRELLPTLAAAAGVSLIMTPDVQGRVSINLRDVLAIDALRAVIEEANLTVGDQFTASYPPVVFYDLPLNVNTASAAAIKERFRVSREVAEWIVQARLK